MKLPKSYADITVEQFQQAHAILNSGESNLNINIKLIAYLSGKTVEYVEGLEPAIISAYRLSLSFLNDDIDTDAKVHKWIVVKGQPYKAILDMEQFKAGALITLKYLEEQNKHVELLNQMLATIFVPMTWYGKVHKYDGNKHNKIAEDMKHVKMDKIYGVLMFKKKVLENLNPVIENCLNEATQTIQKEVEWIKAQMALETL